ncbi:hypothetical protein [Methanosarcina lacustris]|nr:hypothetical protein [Methanosarcina lacustris]
MQSGSTKYVINGEELSSKLTEEYGDNGYWDLGEYISINVSEMCGLDLKNRDEDLNIFFIHTPSKQVIQKAFIPSIYLDDEIPGEEYDEGGIWVPPQLLALDNSTSTKSVDGSACLDDVQKIDDDKSTTYYPNNAASTCEYFEFGLNKSVLESFGATFLDYEHLNISGAKIKIVYAKHDNSFRWGKLEVRDQTSGTSCEHYLFDKNMKMYNYNRRTYIEDEFDLPYITTTEDLENLNVSIFAKIPGNGHMHYIHIDYIAVYIPCIVKISPAPVTPQGNLIHIGSVNVTTSIEKGSGVNKYVTGVAVVTILDNYNNPVEGAEVSGYWSGAASDTFKDQQTDYKGTVTLSSNKVDYNSGTLTFTFNVTNVDVNKNFLYTWDGNTVSKTVEYTKGNRIHIESVDVTTSTRTAGSVPGVGVGVGFGSGGQSESGSGDLVTATAVVTILDNYNNPVEGAKVSGSWSGAASDTFNNEGTGKDGTVILELKDVEYGVNPLTFIFNVTDVTLASYTLEGNTVSKTVEYTKGNRIHIESVSVTSSIKDDNKVTATAVVTILDNYNTPVEGAKVSGSWSGAASEMFNNKETGKDGTVTLKSKTADYEGDPLAFTFNVNAVTFASYTLEGNTVVKTVKYP